MNCKKCKNEIPDGSVFCMYCGERVVRDRKRKDDIKIPAPRQLPSGKWRIELRAEGVSGTFDTKKEAEKWAVEVRAEFISRGKKRSPTLSEAIDDYILSKSNVLSPSTIRGYRTIQRSRFLNYMNKPISSVSDWQKVINEEAVNCSPKTLKNAWGFIGSVLRKNGVDIKNVVLPQIIKKERPFLDARQIEIFVKAVKGAECEIGALLALHGLRRSEIFALSWESIDLKKKTITVSGAVVPDETHKFVYKETNKNVSSQRVVPIMIPELYGALKQAEKSRPVIDCNIETLRRRINKICAECGLPEVGIHGLRHSFCSLGYHLKMSESEIMALGGWSDYETIHRVYLHLAEEDKRAAENQMSQFYAQITHDILETL